MYFIFALENKESSDCSAPVEPAEVLLARLLDQEIPARLPRVFSGPDSLKLSAAMERGIAILHRQHPDTRSVIFSPGHPEGVLAALAEAIEALHPGLTRRKLRQIPPSGWPGAISRTLMARATVPRHLLVVDPLDELWEPHVGDRERGQFLHQLTTMAGLRSTCVLFVLDTRKLEHCQRSRLLQPCLNSRFHLRTGGPRKHPVASLPRFPRRSGSSSNRSARGGRVPACCTHGRWKPPARSFSGTEPEAKARPEPPLETPGWRGMKPAHFRKNRTQTGLGARALNPVASSAPLSPLIRNTTRLSDFWFPTIRNRPSGVIPNPRGTSPPVG